MEQKVKIDFKKLIIGVLVFSVLLVAFSLVYYYTYFLPQKESMRLKFEEEKEIKQLELEIKQIELERQKQEQLERQLEKERLEKEAIRALLKQCLNNAYEAYKKGWNRECERIGKGKDCNLPASSADTLNEYHKEHREDCFKIYPLD